EQTATALVAALTADRPIAEEAGLSPAVLEAAVTEVLAVEDREFGGFGTAPKFPTTPVLAFLLEQGGNPARELGRRTLARMAASPLRDPIEGGFFRYAVHRDWSEPHYERMLADNAQLLACYAAIGDEATSTGIAGFLLDVLRPSDESGSGGFASGQDSESEIDGVRVEGGYYALDAAARATQPPPPLDGKVLTGLNGLAIGALADAGVRFDRDDWITAARDAADAVLAIHGGFDTSASPTTQPKGAPLRRASLDGRVSDAVATLEDYGGFAGGLLRLALATGDSRYAVVARDLVESCSDGRSVAAPSGGDPVLAARGLALPPEVSDGASPSGRALLADAALLLAALSGDDRHRRIAERAIAPALPLAPGQPLSFGAALAIAVRLGRAVGQLVVVGPIDSALAAVARRWGGSTRVLALVTEEQAGAFAAVGFELFAGRVSRGGSDTAYLCEHFVCDLPLTDATALADRLAV
ncbi:thioredoxin domain-containing protein, partial [Pseudolysinimonas sp.]|uniref:thioredoxin domain-containing protein n=1 Tax=Pseudolysinimonas sp. TaxID=2680009 RepID=UPI00286BCBA7